MLRSERESPHYFRPQNNPGLPFVSLHRSVNTDAFIIDLHISLSSAGLSRLSHLVLAVCKASGSDPARYGTSSCGYLPVFPGCHRPTVSPVFLRYSYSAVP